MKRLRSSLLLRLSGVAISLLATPYRSASQAQPASQPANTIVVYVTATHKDGSAGSLSAQELNFTLDKKPAQVSAVEPAKDEPMVFALLVDVSGSDGGNGTAIKDAALRLFQGLAGNGNQGYLVLFNELLAMSAAPVTYEHVQENLNATKFIGGTALYDAIERTITQKFASGPLSGIRRRTIVVISDGDDNASHLSSTRVAEVAQKQGVAVFSLLVPTKHTGAPSERALNLQEICRVTGGKSVLAEKANSIELLLSAVESQWKVSLVSERPPDQKMHALQVKSIVRDVEISAPDKISLR